VITSRGDERGEGGKGEPRKGSKYLSPHAMVNDCFTVKTGRGGKGVLGIVYGKRVTVLRL